MHEPKAENSGRSFLHPLSGGLVLGADWLFFSGTVFSGGAGMFAAATLGFLTGLGGVTFIQRNYSNDPWTPAILKGLLSGIAIGVPFPVFGTLLGGAILAMSGLDKIRDQAAKRVLTKTFRKNASEEYPRELEEK